MKAFVGLCVVVFMYIGALNAETVTLYADPNFEGISCL